jgi:hypothetical protein
LNDALHEVNLRQVGNDVVALFMTQRTPGTPREIRLTVDRLSRADGSYGYVLDPTDVFGTFRTLSFARRAEAIRRKPRGGTARSLIPLYVSHVLRDPNATGYYFLRGGGFLTKAAGRTTAIALKNALDNPLAVGTYRADRQDALAVLTALHRSQSASGRSSSGPTYERG